MTDSLTAMERSCRSKTKQLELDLVVPLNAPDTLLQMPITSLLDQLMLLPIVQIKVMTRLPA